MLPSILTMRLDAFLFENGFCQSRTEAKNFILEGSVSVNGKAVKKPAFEVFGDEDIRIDKSSKKYVSRGGLKLEAALDHFGVSVSGIRGIDIGASRQNNHSFSFLSIYQYLFPR